jgi:hypothetical protein
MRLALHLSALRCSRPAKRRKKVLTPMIRRKAWIAIGCRNGTKMCLVLHVGHLTAEAENTIASAFRRGGAKSRPVFHLRNGIFIWRTSSLENANASGPEWLVVGFIRLRSFTFLFDSHFDSGSANFAGLAGPRFLFGDLNVGSSGTPRVRSSFGVLIFCVVLLHPIIRGFEEGRSSASPVRRPGLVVRAVESTGV